MRAGLGLAGITLGLLIGAVLVVPAHAELCETGGWSGGCTVSNEGTHVDIGATANDPGSPGAVPPRGEPQPAPVEEECDRTVDLCREVLEVVMLPDVTLADLASFRPATPSLTGEPMGFGVAGLPTNLVASASEQRIPGTLLGWDVTVRFVPVGFVFDHGDGTSGSATTGGASWPALGQAQFTPTATSHVYRVRGTYDVSVTVQYAASVDFGAGVWRRVPGYVTATVGGYGVRVVEARTALVHESCVENPSGPGC